MQAQTKEIKLNSEDIQQDSNKHKYPLQTKKKKKENSQDSFNLEVVQKI